MSVDTLHFAAASYYWLCVYYEYKYINIPPEVDKLFELYGDKAKLSYLAIWNMVSKSASCQIISFEFELLLNRLQNSTANVRDERASKLRNETRIAILFVVQ